MTWVPCFKLENCPLAVLFDEDMLGDDLEVWMEDSFMLKRTFRQCALIAGLIEKKPSRPKKNLAGRSPCLPIWFMMCCVSTNRTIFCCRRPARMRRPRLLDIHRLGDLLARIKGQIIHKNLKEVSPLAVPIMLEIGRETVVGEANETLLAEAAENLISEAMTV